MCSLEKKLLYDHKKEGQQFERKNEFQETIFKKNMKLIRKN